MANDDGNWIAGFLEKRASQDEDNRSGSQPCLENLNSNLIPTMVITTKLSLSIDLGTMDLGSKAQRHGHMAHFIKNLG